MDSTVYQYCTVCMRRQLKFVEISWSYREYSNILAHAFLIELPLKLKGLCSPENEEFANSTTDHHKLMSL